MIPVEKPSEARIDEQTAIQEKSVEQNEEQWIL